MQFRIIIRTDSPTFAECAGAEIARMLRELAGQIESDPLGNSRLGALRDSNHRPCGQWTVTR